MDATLLWHPRGRPSAPLAPRARVAIGLALLGPRSRGRRPAPPGGPARGNGAGGAPAALRVTTAVVEGRPVQRSVDTVGSLLAWEEAIARSQIQGTILRLHADLGDAVREGQPLADLDRREANLAVDQLQADLVAARENHARARAAVGREPREPRAGAGEPSRARGRRRARARRRGVEAARVRAGPGAPREGADRGARRRPGPRPVPGGRGARPDDRDHAHPARRPGARGRGPARGGSGRRQGRRGAGPAARGGRRARPEARHRHGRRGADHGRRRQASRRGRRVRQGQHPALHPGGHRSPEVHGHRARARRAGGPRGPGGPPRGRGLREPRVPGPGHARRARGGRADAHPRPRGARAERRGPPQAGVLRAGGRPDAPGRPGAVRPGRGARLRRGDQQGVRHRRRPRAGARSSRPGSGRAAGWRSRRGSSPARPSPPPGSPSSTRAPPSSRSPPTPAPAAAAPAAKP